MMSQRSYRQKSSNGAALGTTRTSTIRTDWDVAGRLRTSMVCNGLGSRRTDTCWASEAAAKGLEDRRGRGARRAARADAQRRGRPASALRFGDSRVGEPSLPPLIRVGLLARDLRNRGDFGRRWAHYGNYIAKCPICHACCGGDPTRMAGLAFYSESSFRGFRNSMN